MTKDDKKTWQDYQLESMDRLGGFGKNIPPSNINHSFDSVSKLSLEHGVSQHSAGYKAAKGKILHPQAGVTTRTQIHITGDDEPSV